MTSVPPHTHFVFEMCLLLQGVKRNILRAKVGNEACRQSKSVAVCTVLV